MRKTKLKFLELNLEYNREDPAERVRYEARRKYQLDYNTALLTAYEEGYKIGFKIGFKIGLEETFAEGRLITRNEIAKQMLKHNIPVEQIVEVTRLSVEEICVLKS
ncbi:hypothetical protein [Fluviispira vulneris]|uniref:hypothetical protein n=1 Tax=Fluviispira vulneris TaxID=2763012 RepID=UPI0016477103|nr:hypothetical protein [Fluviispira vulneris]